MPPSSPCRRSAWLLGAWPTVLWAQTADPPLLLAHHTDATLERVTVTGARPSSLPIEIPTSTESITGAAIERTVNATDAEDALKYFPSLLVRKRCIGDYDHAVLATRASGTGNSTDLRLRWRFAKPWTAAFGIDNLGNATYWAFHPYPQRTVSAELRYDL